MSQLHTWLGPVATSSGVTSGSAFADLLALSQQAIHRRDRRQVGAFVEQGGPYLGGGFVAEAFLVQYRDHGFGFGGCQGLRGVSRSWGPVEGVLLLPVVAGTGTSEDVAGSFASNDGGEFVDAGIQDGGHDSSVSALFEISSKSACTFPCT